MRESHEPIPEHRYRWLRTGYLRRGATDRDLVLPIVPHVFLLGIELDLSTRSYGRKRTVGWAGQGRTGVERNPSTT